MISILEPYGCCYKLWIWCFYLITSLVLNLGLAISDISWDAYLCIDYHGKMMNTTVELTREQKCQELKESANKT